VRLLAGVNTNMLVDSTNLFDRESCMEEEWWRFCWKEEDLEEEVLFIGVSIWGILLDLML
jgi:hypothetical protein